MNLYALTWRSPSLPFSQKQLPINVPVGSVVSNAASLRFTGKGAANYGKIQQENLLRLLENFAGDTAPDNPTVGQLWYDTSDSILKVCSATAPLTETWEDLNPHHFTAGSEPPVNPELGNLWFKETGSTSGILYVYNKVGRYPPTDWDAVVSGYFPAANTTTLNVIRNASTFAASGTNYGECYIHGYTGITPSDVNGTILVNAVVTVVPKGVLLGSKPVNNGYIVWDTTATLSAGGAHFFVVRQLGNGSWQYDNDVTCVDFTPVDGMYAIGTITNSEVDNNVSPGVTAANVWIRAIQLDVLTQVPSTLADGAIGGWSQLWPTVNMAGGRDEYDYIYGLLARLIGDPYAFGGSGAIDRAIRYLTPFNTLDASLRNTWAATLPLDGNTSTGNGALGLLKNSPSSNDWDTILAAARYAINRLELPANLYTQVSELPFTQDGQQAPASLLSLSSSSVQYPTALRRANRQAGLITQVRAYQQTINALEAAYQTRYAIKGILGASGTNTTFAAGVSVTQQSTFSANAAGTPFSSTVTHGLKYVFDGTLPDLERFFYAAQAIEILLTHTPGGSPTAGDLALKAITDSSGRIRVTADSTLVMIPGGSPALNQAPIALGFKDFTGGGITLVTLTSGSASIMIRASLGAAGIVNLFVDINAGGATTGTFGAVWNYINDTETFNNPSSTRVYPAPRAYQAGDKLGSSLFV